MGIGRIRGGRARRVTGAVPARRRGGARRAAALLFLVGAAASIVAPLANRRLGARAVALALASGLDRSDPEEAREIALEPAGDRGAALAVAAVLFGPGGGRAASSGRPLSAAAIPAAEFARARDLMLDALAARPGWPLHRYLLGLLDREDAGPPASGGRRMRVLELAARGAPGLNAAWTALADLVLARWQRLAPERRIGASEVFRRCLLSEDYVARRFQEIVGAVGRTEALRLLPEDRGPLEAAAGILARDGNVGDAGRLLSRAEEAERRSREEDLRALEVRRRFRDEAGLAKSCREWFVRHPYRQFDDPPGRASLVRLLEVWPARDPGGWESDPRAELVRFFLTGRQADVRPKILARAIAGLSNVPASVGARIALRSGDLVAAEGLATKAGTLPSPEWDPFFLDLADRELREGRPGEARAALARLSPGAGDGCEALLLQRGVARALGQGEALGVIDRRLGLLQQIPPEEDWSALGSLSLCVDPEWGAGRSLEVAVGPGSPAIAAFGWDDARQAALSLPADRTSFRVSFSGLSGRRRFWVSFLVGGEGRSLHAAVREPS